METFKCTICGKDHKIFKAVESATPDKVLEIPEAELSKRVKEIQNSFIIDEKDFLLRGDIFIYKEDTKEPFFTWSVWASIAFENFKANAEALKEGNNVQFNGILESSLPFYSKTKGLKVKVIVNINYDYAVIKIEEESEIKKDQIEKVSDKRIFEILEMAYHQS